MHPDLDLVARRLAYNMLDAIARETRADGAGNRCRTRPRPPDSADEEGTPPRIDV